MTRYEISLEEVVLRGLPAGFADGLGPLVEARLAAFVAEGAPVVPIGREVVTVDGPDALADVVAGRVWAAVQAGHGGGGR